MTHVDRPDATAIERAAGVLLGRIGHRLLTGTGDSLPEAVDDVRLILDAALAPDALARAIYEASPAYRGAHGTWSYEDLKAGWSEKPYSDYPHLYDDLLRTARAVRAALLGEDR